jgi:hypothetical protein
VEERWGNRVREAQAEGFYGGRFIGVTEGGSGGRVGANRPVRKVLQDASEVPGRFAPTRGAFDGEFVFAANAGGPCRGPVR